MNTLKTILKPIGLGLGFLILVAIFAPTFPFIGMIFDTIPLLFCIILYIISELYFKDIQIKVIIIGSLIFTVLNFLYFLFTSGFDTKWLLMYSLPILYMMVTIGIIKMRDR